jgi:hypothetical protein
MYCWIKTAQSENATRKTGFFDSIGPQETFAK